MVYGCGASAARLGKPTDEGGDCGTSGCPPAVHSCCSTASDASLSFPSASCSSAVDGLERPFSFDERRSSAASAAVEEAAADSLVVPSPSCVGTASAEALSADAPPSLRADLSGCFACGGFQGALLCARCFGERGVPLQSVWRFSYMDAPLAAVSVATAYFASLLASVSLRLGQVSVLNSWLTRMMPVNWISTLARNDSDRKRPAENPDKRSRQRLLKQRRRHFSGKTKGPAPSPCASSGGPSSEAEKVPKTAQFAQGHIQKTPSEDSPPQGGNGWVQEEFKDGNDRTKFLRAASQWFLWIVISTALCLFSVCFWSVIALLALARPLKWGFWRAAVTLSRQCVFAESARRPWREGEPRLSPRAASPPFREVLSPLSGQEKIFFTMPWMTVTAFAYCEHISVEDLKATVAERLLRTEATPELRSDATAGGSQPLSSKELAQTPLGRFSHPRLLSRVERVWSRYCWVRDANFSVDRHVLRLSKRDLHELLPETVNASLSRKCCCSKNAECQCLVDERDVCALVNVAVSQPLDPHRPLWQFLILENVSLPLNESGAAENPSLQPYAPRLGSAVVFRMHHSVGDGVSILHMFLEDLLTSGHAEEGAEGVSGKEKIWTKGERPSTTDSLSGERPA